jgi:hypothetical protein
MCFIFILISKKGKEEEGCMKEKKNWDKVLPS